MRAHGVTRSSAWQSILRQLNQYGFRKSRAKAIFAHGDFVRGRRDRLVHVRTRALQRQRAPLPPNADAVPETERAFWTEHVARVEALVAESRALAATLASGGGGLLDPEDLFG